MKSMTGFSYNEYQDPTSSFAITLKSYNNRYLDIILNIPSSLGALEPRFRDLLTSSIKRGRVELNISVRELEESLNVTLNKNIIRPYIEALGALIKEAGLRDSINLSHLLRMEGILRSHKVYNTEGYWEKIEPVLAKTIKEFEKTRAVEGERTKTNIKELVAKIKDSVEMIEGFIPKIEVKIRDTLSSKLKESLKNEIDENRIVSETALFLIKFDIREEVVRMKSHLKNFSSALREKVPVGKKLDFICQELNREINTIGSKSFFLEVNDAVIAVKDAIETVREQLRNVE
jgi:uncharacterized protein (TIGR00255 family)